MDQVPKLQETIPQTNLDNFQCHAKICHTDFDDILHSADLNTPTWFWVLFLTGSPLS